MTTSSIEDRLVKVIGVRAQIEARLTTLKLAHSTERHSGKNGNEVLHVTIIAGNEDELMKLAGLFK